MKHPHCIALPSKPTATRGLTIARFASCVLAAGLAFSVWPVRASEVLTQHNDSFRTGANLGETALSPSAVNVDRFGKLFSYTVDGQVYAQPLVVENLSIGGGTHNVVYVATMEDSVYAFDADRNTTYWHADLATGSNTPVPITDITNNNNLNIHGNVGILSTPVIDRGSSTIYVLARTKNTSNGSYHQQLHALDLSTGAEKFGGPVEVTASGFDAKKQSQRTALGLSGGNIYLAWASHEDIGPYHGWVMAYNATTLRQTAVFNASASGSAAGIWQAGQGPTFDEAGNVYFMTGNGDWNGTTNFGMSFIKLSPSLRLLDWFTEADFASENSRDDDLGASGVLILPTSAGYPSTQYIIGAGKQGRMFVLDKNDLGHLSSGDTGAHQMFQAIQTAACSHHLHGSPIYWKSAAQGQLVYLWGENDVGKAFRFNNSTLTTSPALTTAVKSPSTGCGMPGAFLSLSANGGTNGVLWANCIFSGDALHNTVPGILRAFDANNLGVELWNSRMNSARDDLGNFAKFVPPTVANGKVYQASFSNRVHVFGAIGTPPPPPPPPPPQDGVYQAESAVLAGGATFESTNVGFHGTGYVNSPPSGGTITFNNVVGNGGGTKNLAIRYANGGTTARTGSISVNGITMGITFNPTGAWTTWQTMTVAVTLANSATNTLQFASTGGDLGNIDEITVPPALGTSITLQAEDAALGGGTIAESANTGFRGSGYANSPASGGTITFNNVSGNGGGVRSLTIRYANGATASRAGNLVVNGATSSVTFAPTGSWTTWQTMTVPVTLKNDSTNTIQFATTGADLGNIDEITIQ